MMDAKEALISSIKDRALAELESPSGMVIGSDFWNDYGASAFEFFPDTGAAESYLSAIIGVLVNDEFESVDDDDFDENGLLPIDHCFRDFGLDCESFVQWKRENENQNLSLSEAYDGFLESAYEGGLILEVSQTIYEEAELSAFSQPRLLEGFFEWAASCVKDDYISLNEDEREKFFDGPGVLKAAEIPAWAALRIRHRDNDKCIKCERIDDVRVDFLVRPERGGLNNFFNLGCICKRCSRS